MNVVKKSGNQANIQYAEFSCMMYATRKKSPSSVWVRGYKHNLGVAMFPNRNSEEAFARIMRAFCISNKKTFWIEITARNWRCLEMMSLSVA